MVWIITGEIVPIEARAKWADMLTCVWTASALAGPLLGGVFSRKRLVLTMKLDVLLIPSS